MDKRETRAYKAYERALSAVTKGKSKYDKQVVLARIPMGLEGLEASMSISIPCTGDVVADNLVRASIGVAALTCTKHPSRNMSSVFKALMSTEERFCLSTSGRGLRFVVDEDLDDPETVMAIQAHNNSVWYDGKDGFTRDHVKPFINGMVALASAVLNGAGNFALSKQTARAHAAGWVLDVMDNVVLETIDADKAEWKTPLSKSMVSYRQWFASITSDLLPAEISVEISGRLLEEGTPSIPSTIPLSLVNTLKASITGVQEVSDVESLTLGYLFPGSDSEKIGA